MITTIRGDGDKLPAQAGIARHTAGSRHASHPCLLRRAQCLGYQHLHDGRLHTRAQIAERLAIIEDRRMVAQKITDGSFQAAETEIGIRLM